MPFPSIRLLDVQQLDAAVALFEAQLREHGIATSVHDVRRFDALATEMPTPLNSATYAWDVREMKAAGILDFATELHNPNFADIAQAAGLFGVRVEYPEALEEALKKPFEHHRPALIDVVTSRQELSMPPTIKLDQAVGFSHGQSNLEWPWR